MRCHKHPLYKGKQKPRFDDCDLCWQVYGSGDGVRHKRKMFQHGDWNVTKLADGIGREATYEPFTGGK